MPAFSIVAHHIWVSSLRVSSVSSGPVPTVVKPSFCNCSCTLGVSSAVAMASASLLVTSSGVPFGT